MGKDWQRFLASFNALESMRLQQQQRQGCCTRWCLAHPTNVWPLSHLWNSVFAVKSTSVTSAKLSDVVTSSEASLCF